MVSYFLRHLTRVVCQVLFGESVCWVGLQFSCVLRQIHARLAQFLHGCADTVRYLKTDCDSVSDTTLGNNVKPAVNRSQNPHWHTHLNFSQTFFTKYC